MTVDSAEFASLLASATTSDDAANSASFVAPTVSQAAASSAAPTESGSLSTGTKIGIGVGVSVSVLSVLIIMALAWRARHRRKKLRGVGATDSGTSTNKAELPNKDLPRTYGRSELSEKRAPVELDAAEQSRKAELVGVDVHFAELAENGTGTSTAVKSSEK